VQRAGMSTCIVCSKLFPMIARSFLVAELHMNLLAEQLSLGELEDTLIQLPSKIDETYKQALDQIKGYSSKMKEVAKTVLMWMTCVTERLSARTLQHVLATTSRKLDKKYLISLSTITAPCAGLVVVQDDGSWQEKTVRFVRECYLPYV
jgi:hypothetical protein